MNKLKIIFSLVFLFFLTTCGLDTVWYLDPPETRINANNHNVTSSDNKDPDKNYVAFRAKENEDDTEGGKYKGTAVYYKIYNSLSALTSDKSRIDNLISSSTSGNSSTTTIRETLKYQPLGFFKDSSRLGDEVFIGKSDSNSKAKIEIRFYKQGAFEPFIKIDDVELTDSDSNPIVPCRAGGKQWGFDFFDNYKVNVNDENNSVSSNLKYGIKPVDGDEDFSYTTNSDVDEKRYYIKLYAFSVGQDRNFSSQYSKALDIGEIYIEDMGN